MCGICDIVYSENLCEDDISLVSGMNDSMIHRGPDDSGRFIDNNVPAKLRQPTTELNEGLRLISEHFRKIVTAVPLDGRLREVNDVSSQII